MAFTLLTMTVLAALCLMIYYITAEQQARDFRLRMRNRALTAGTMLAHLPKNGNEMLSTLDSNTLVYENINVYNEKNEIIYEFDRNKSDRLFVEAKTLSDARLQEEVRVAQGEKHIIALYYAQGKEPIVVVAAARDVIGTKNLLDLQQTMVIAFVAGTLLAIVTGWLFSRQLLKPLTKISEKVNSISANNIEARLPVPGINDEWKRLAETFNNLLRRLQDSFEIQGRFISNASHELSTPLTAVSNQIDVTLQKERTNTEYLAVLESIRGDVQHMTDLTQHLLTLARTARGGAVQTSPIRVDEILMELPSLLKKISADYTAIVHFDELPDDENLSTVQGNYELLLSAFRNIAENGCKYSPDHTVQISLSFVGSRIVVLFSNNYESFNPAELHSIFQPFQRGSNAEAEPGYGLGLSLTRRIILLHKGEINAEIPQPGKILISAVLTSSF
ncbi:ATP-binding protein [Sediminibacterium soli]|uniref:ATP-binding protein n=1 Tax=Sediminibacterium soli TaxID=2698829 RepID=UPI00137B25B3|nr:ATP-binding protein [Sediminibacterium soli]NCI46802.1 HAMP domain-containing protein [Sediminibacterium soli]